MVDGVWVHQPARLIIRSECNPEVSISFFWLERGGRWGSSPSTSLADHQMWTQIQKKHFIFLAGERWQIGFESIDQPGWSSEVERNRKISISFYWQERIDRWGSSSSTNPVDYQKWTQSKNEHFIFLAGEGWQMVFESIEQPGWSSEVDRNPKMSISFYWLERGGRWGLSP